MTGRFADYLASAAGPRGWRWVLLRRCGRGAEFLAFIWTWGGVGGGDF